MKGFVLYLPMHYRNGVPFATSALCGLSRLSVWWIKPDIDHQRIDPGAPQQNGCHKVRLTLKVSCSEG